MADCDEYGRLGAKVRGMKTRTSTEVRTVRDNRANAGKRAVPNEKLSAERRQRGSMWP